MNKYLYNNGTHLRLFLPIDYKSRSYETGVLVTATYDSGRGRITITRGGGRATKAISQTYCIHSDIARFMPKGIYKLATNTSKSLTFQYAEDLQSRKDKGKVSLARREDNEKIHRGFKRWNLRPDHKKKKKKPK